MLHIVIDIILFTFVYDHFCHGENRGVNKEANGCNWASSAVDSFFAKINFPYLIPGAFLYCLTGGTTEVFSLTKYRIFFLENFVFRPSPVRKIKTEHIILKIQ